MMNWFSKSHMTIALDWICMILAWDILVSNHILHRFGSELVAVWFGIRNLNLDLHIKVGHAIIAPFISQGQDRNLLSCDISACALLGQINNEYFYVV